MAEDVSEVEYFHFMFEKHEIVLSNGAATESMFAGREAMKALTAEARTEIFTIFPELSDSFLKPQPAVLIPAGRHQKALIERHKNNQKPLIN